MTERRIGEASQIRPRLQGKTALVVGESQSPEFELIAQALAQTGAQLAIAAATIAEATKSTGTLRGLGTEARPLGCDSNEPEPGVIAAAVDALGRLDILVWVAAPLPFNVPYTETLEASAEERGVEGLTGLVCTCDQAVAHMTSRSGGSVIVVNGSPRARAWPDVTAAIMKHAIIDVVRTLADESAARAVRVNVVSPQWTSAPQNELHEIGRPNRSVQPVGLGALAETVVWLASDATKALTGAHLELGRETHRLPIRESWRSATETHGGASSSPFLRPSPRFRSVQ